MKNIQQAAFDYAEKTVDQCENISISTLKEYAQIDFQEGVKFATQWISFENEPIPKDGMEYLTKNDRQGGVLSLISWNKIHNHYQNKGEYIFESNAGTHWRPISFL